MKSLVHSSKIANKNPNDYEARSNIMWTATWALNTLVSRGKITDWNVHMLGQAVGAYTNATHGMTLSAVSLAYYKFIMPYGLDKFKRFAVNVWNIDTADKTEEQIAVEGLDAMKNWMIELSLVMNISELGANSDMIDDIAKAVFPMTGGYKQLSQQDIKDILNQSL